MNDVVRPSNPTLSKPSNDVSAFLDAVKRAPAPGTARGRLIFALDATMSRQPTWDTACRLQAEMFSETAKTGGLDVQLVYFRGLSECRASKWVADAGRLADMMGRIQCIGGHTQLIKILKHAAAETRLKKVSALVFVGDAMEESFDDLCAAAGELALVNVPVFLFQEGRDSIAERAFREVARLTRGAWCPFDLSSAKELASLLRAVAAYASGGRAALAALSGRDGGAASEMLKQLPGG